MGDSRALKPSLALWSLYLPVLLQLRDALLLKRPSSPSFHGYLLFGGHTGTGGKLLVPLGF